MKAAAAVSFAAHLKALREASGYTQEELATIAGLSVHAVSALERGQRRRPHIDTVRALSAALDLPVPARDAFLASARAPADIAAADELSGVGLPLAPTALIGRQGDVDTLRQLLDDPGARLVTLIGPGGVGKTRLALELARTIAADGATRVVFVPLAAIRDPAFVASAIAEALGFANVTALDLPARARVACGDHPTLLVLDNFEQVLDAAPLVADLVASVGSLRVLATSRAAIRVRGEREYSVGPLAMEVGSEATSPADLARAPAVRLFVERVRDLQPDFRLTTANASTITAICRRLDALPLALELAAPWIKVLPEDELLRRLGYDILLTAAGPRDLPERQRTMNATVAWSYHLLGAGEQRAFRRLGALPGRFAMAAAAAVLGDDDDPAGGGDEALGVVASLIDKSLLLRAEGAVSGRPLFQMLETVRAYAALELAKCGERESALEGLASYCTREAALARVGLDGTAQGEWLDRVRFDLENYRAAMAWLIERGRAEEAAGIAIALKYFWLIRGHGAEGLRWYEQILEVPSLSPVGESKALAGAAVMWYSSGNLDRARQALHRASALAGSAGEAGLQAEADYMCGHVERAAGNFGPSREQFTRSLEGFRALKDPSGAGKAITGLAALALATNDSAEAERRLDEAALVLRDAGSWFLSFGLWMRALLAVRRGNPDEAIAWAHESLARIRALHDRYAFVYALVPLAAAAALKGNDVWAARILGVRDAVAERTGATLVDQFVHDVRAETEREVRARLGPHRWTRAYAAGRSTSIDRLLKDIETAR